MTPIRATRSLLSATAASPHVGFDCEVRGRAFVGEDVSLTAYKWVIPCFLRLYSITLGLGFP